MPLHWKIDECAAYHDRLRLGGWCFNATPRITGVEAVFPVTSASSSPSAASADPAIVPLASYGLPSPDVAADLDPAATHTRFDEFVAAPPEALGRDFTLRFTLADGSVIDGDSALGNALAGDPCFACFSHFVEQLQRIPGGTVLELGAHARSALTRRPDIPAHLDYLGLDVLAGPDGNSAGDAHRLADLLGSRRFVAAMSFSVFEHLAMPWKVALELNRVLAPGGLVFTQTHQTWPMHEEPWDFWRFSRHSWQTIFNTATGFEVLEAVSGDPAHIHACYTDPVTRGLAASRDAHLGSASLVRKISDTALTWPVPVELAARDRHPYLASTD
ncbi:MAG: hypothetical protein HY736_27700 [Verrucomicrobia bacterium]|nr:hypothetical protein [Verrucomicrobiota bacterium]